MLQTEASFRPYLNSNECYQIRAIWKSGMMKVFFLRRLTKETWQTGSLLSDLNFNGPFRECFIRVDMNRVINSIWRQTIQQVV